MSQPEQDEAPEGAQGEAPQEAAVPTHLRFLGRSDYFVAGVPQSSLKVVDEPAAHGEVAAATAADLMATGLYAPMAADEYEAEQADKGAEQAEGVDA